MAFVMDGVNQIDADELQELLKSEKRGEVKIIDVRELEEYAAGHIPGLPLVPMSVFQHHIGELNKDDEYVFVCRSGQRSQAVSKYLKTLGFEKVTNFNGGMLSWKGDIAQGTEAE